MKTVPLSEVKDDLSRFLRLAETEEIVITRHGKPVARLVGEEDARRADALRAMAKIKELRKQTKGATIGEILAWRDEGRK